MVVPLFRYSERYEGVGVFSWFVWDYGCVCCLCCHVVRDGSLYFTLFWDSSAFWGLDLFYDGVV